MRLIIPAGRRAANISCHILDLDQGGFRAVGDAVPE